MWKYQKELEEVFRDYRDPDQNSYDPRVKISNTCLYVSMGPDYYSLTFENGMYTFNYRSVDMRCDHKGETEFKSEEEAILRWLGSFSYLLPKNGETRKRIGEFEECLNALCHEKPNQHNAV